MAARKIAIIVGKNRGSRGLYLTLLLVAVCAIAIAMLGTAPGKQHAVSSREAMLTIDFGQRAGVRTFAGEVTSTMTISDALSIAGVKGSFAVKLNEKGLLKTLDGRSGLWLVLHNNERVETPLTQTSLSPGDVVRVEPVGS